MDYKTQHVKHLLEELARRTGQGLDYSGFGRMSVELDEKVSQRYLYETLFRKVDAVTKSKKAKSIHLQSSQKLDVIARYLGYKDFREFIAYSENPIDPVLLGMQGVYNCYIRRNSETTVIFCSPVEVSQKDNHVKWILKGPEQLYEGTVELSNGCIFVLMKSENGKQFHHAYAIGKRIKPNVLQGMFSGISTNSRPIGGRVILVRSNQRIEQLKTKKSSVIEMQNSTVLEERRVAEFLHDYHTNNLSVHDSTTFDLDDLGTCA